MDGTHDYIHYLIGNFTSVLVYDAENRPVAWCTSDPYGAATTAYTVPHARRTGVGKFVAQEIARRMTQAGDFCHAFVSDENEASVSLMERLGNLRLEGDFQPCKYLPAARDVRPIVEPSVREVHTTEKTNPVQRLAQKQSKL